MGTLFKKKLKKILNTCLQPQPFFYNKMSVEYVFVIENKSFIGTVSVYITIPPSTPPPLRHPHARRR